MTLINKSRSVISLLLWAPIQKEKAIQILRDSTARLPTFTSATPKWQESTLGWQPSWAGTSSSQEDCLIPLGIPAEKTLLPGGAGRLQKGLFQADPAQVHGLYHHPNLCILSSSVHPCSLQNNAVKKCSRGRLPPLHTLSCVASCPLVPWAKWSYCLGCFFKWLFLPFSVLSIIFFLLYWLQWHTNDGEVGNLHARYRQ